MTKIVVNAMCMGQNRKNQAVDIKRKIEEGVQVQVMRPQTRPQIDVVTIAWYPPSPPADVSTQHEIALITHFTADFTTAGNEPSLSLNEVLQFPY